jgi:hypothetical protein
MDLNKAIMHNKPTYDELVRDTITLPTDKIELPDRVATQIRNTPQLLRFDDDALLNLNEEQEKITKERIKEIEIRNITSEHNAHTHTVYQAAPQPPTQLPFEPPPPPTPPAAKPQTMGTASQTHFRNQPQDVSYQHHFTREEEEDRHQQHRKQPRYE